ncbi:MAG: hypothetical protein E6G20_10585 [Actinobacteria bacterium]|nr:MAG: hypothetical protein E6G20_10585 [Actinomycetota bacterium]
MRGDVRSARCPAQSRALQEEGARQARAHDASLRGGRPPRRQARARDRRRHRNPAVRAPRGGCGPRGGRRARRRLRAVCPRARSRQRLPGPDFVSCGRCARPARRGRSSRDSGAQPRRLLLSGRRSAYRCCSTARTRDARVEFSARPARRTRRDLPPERLALARETVVSGLSASTGCALRGGRGGGAPALGGEPGQVLGVRLPATAMMELGLFPLGIVLLPTEQVPLHIFEERYKELIAECLADQQEFGLLFADAEGVREIGTRAGVIEVLARLEDGRMNVERFRLVELTRGRSFQTGQVEPFADDDDPAAADSVGRALELFNRLRELTGSDVEVPAADSSQLSFELAARVELPAEAKQELLQEASERIRVDRVGELLVDATVTVERQRRAAERAASNGKVDFS